MGCFRGEWVLGAVRRRLGVRSRGTLLFGKVGETIGLGWPRLALIMARLIGVAFGCPYYHNLGDTLRSSPADDSNDNCVCDCVLRVWHAAVWDCERVSCADGE